jgi:hypothetical protein
MCGLMLLLQSLVKMHAAQGAFVVAMCFCRCSLLTLSLPVSPPPLLLLLLLLLHHFHPQQRVAEMTAKGQDYKKEMAKLKAARATARAKAAAAAAK